MWPNIGLSNSMQIHHAGVSSSSMGNMCPSAPQHRVCCADGSAGLTCITTSLGYHACLHFDSSTPQVVRTCAPGAGVGCGMQGLVPALYLSTCPPCASRYSGMTAGTGKQQAWCASYVKRIVTVKRAVVASYWGRVEGDVVTVEKCDACGSTGVVPAKAHSAYILGGQCGTHRSDL
jgi:hypothetical protein